MSVDKEINKQSSSTAGARRTEDSTEIGPTFLKPKGDPGDGDPEDHHRNPCIDIPMFSPPYVAAQVWLRVGNSEVPIPSEAQRQFIREALHAEFITLLPNNEVEISVDQDRVLTVAVWSQPLGNDPDSCYRRARDRSIHHLRGKDLGIFSIFLNEWLIRQLAEQAFNEMDKEYSVIEDNKPVSTPGGAIHLTGLKVEFETKDNLAIVKTIITGFDERPVPDIDFTVTITDELLDNRKVHTTSNDEHDDTLPWLSSLLALFFFPILNQVLFDNLNAYEHQPQGNNEGGVGAAAVSLVRKEIPLPGNQKLVPMYQRIPQYIHGDPFPPGLYFPALITGIVERHPTARIRGPEIVYRDQMTTAGIFSVETTDTFGTVSVNWSSTSDVNIESPTYYITKITFPRPKDDFPARSTRTIHAVVADQDGFRQEMSLTIDSSTLSPIVTHE